MRVRGLVIAVLAVFLLVGCNNKDHEEYKAKVEQYNQEIAEMEKEKERLQKEIADIKVEKGTAKYVVTLEIKQRHYLDIEKMLKDEINAIELQIPVDKEYYDSLEVGDVLDDSFRVGSLLLGESFGSWNIKVIDKEIM